MSTFDAIDSSSGVPQLSWVFPLFRTADQLGELLARVHRVSAALLQSYEIVLVDDACPENCGSIAQAISAKDPRVRVLRLTRNIGQDAALRQGLRLSRGRWTVILDADLQDPPEALYRLWPLRDFDPAGVVFAQRTGAYTSRGRQLTSRVYRAVIERAGRLPRGACLFALLGSEVVARINSVAAGRVSLLALIAASGTRFASVPIQRSVRASGISSYSSFARCRKAALSLWQIFAVRRLSWTFGISQQSTSRSE
jgi:glycosyltransferase involved in cell wall biosynthesis